jgi:hypothetical protein
MIIWNPEKQCCTNDDGSKLKKADSVLSWSNARYAKWCADGIADSGKDSINNSHLWGSKLGWHEIRGEADWKGIPKLGDSNGRY